MQDLRIQLEEIYTYVRSREWTKTFLSKSVLDFIEDEQSKIKIKIQNNNNLLNNIDSIIDRAKRN